MDTSLSDEQHLLKETATRLAADFRADPERIDAQRSAAEAHEAAAELGLFLMRLPEAAGGSGSSALDVALVAEAFAQAPGVIPFVGPLLAVELLRLSGTTAADPVLEGVGGMTIGLGPDLGAATPADRLGEVVAWDCAGAGRLAALVADSGLREVRVSELAGASLPCADLTREMAASGVADEIAVRPISGEALEAWEAFAIAILAADLVGSMSGALDLGVEYVKDRRQFGKPVGAFQAIQHALADAYVSVRAARAAVYFAAWSVDSSLPSEALLAARVAKSYAARAAIEVGELVMQVHGGMGTTWESPCHLFLRRMLLDDATLGDQHVQLAAISTARLEA